MATNSPTFEKDIQNLREMIVDAKSIPPGADAELAIIPNFECIKDDELMLEFDSPSICEHLVKACWGLESIDVSPMS